MSRIDEALNRAGDPRARPSRPAGPGEDVFASPWSTPAPVPRKEAPQPQAVPAAHVPPPAAAPAVPAVAPAAQPPAGGPTPVQAAAAPAVRPAPAPRTLESPEAPVHALRPAIAERFGAGYRERLIVARDANPLLVEQYRLLAATLIQRQRVNHIKTLMVASASPGDGKTLTAINLALVLSESYRHRVLLIDADLRRPTLSEAANLKVRSGLNELMKGNDDRKVSLVALTETLTLLPAGGPEPDPLGGLASNRMQRLLQEAVERFDWVILDSPPAATTADAGLLCSIVDGAILVIRAGETEHAAVQQTVEALGREAIVGVVMNGVDDTLVKGYGDSYADGAATRA